MMLQIKPKLYILTSLFLVLVLYSCQNNTSPVATDDNVVPPTATATATVVPPTIEPATATEPAPTLPPVVTTSTPVPEPVESPTAIPTAEVQDPTATSPPPEPTSTPLPEPTATATSVPIVGQPWLNLFNRVRGMAGLTAVPEKFPLSTGSELHSQYMVMNDKAVAHSEDANNPFYDPAGHQAAVNGNLFATSQTEANYLWGVNFWTSAPFHLIRMISPNLQTVGYGDFVGAGGDVNMAAVMDVGSDRANSPPDVTYPIFFPGDGTETWVVRHSLYEWPDPIGSCPGYTRPTGAPIIVQFGDGSLTPSVSSFTLSMGGTVLDACLFDETSYRNADSYAQEVGRTVLGEQDAVVIMPRKPLAADAEYTVQLVANGQTYTWSFSTIKRAPTD